MPGPLWSKVRRYKDNCEPHKAHRQSGPSASNSYLRWFCTIITTDFNSMSCFLPWCVHNMKYAWNQVHSLTSSSLCFCSRPVGMANPLSGLLLIPRASLFPSTHHVGDENSINPTSQKNPQPLPIWFQFSSYTCFDTHKDKWNGKICEIPNLLHAYLKPNPSAHYPSCREISQNLPPQLFPPKSLAGLLPLSWFHF